MFNVGGGEIIVILLIALVVLGPDRLPEYTRKAAKVAGELRRLSHGFQSEMKQAMSLTDDPAVPADTAATSAGPRLLPPPSTSPVPADGAEDTAPGAQGSSDEPGNDASASGTSAA